jgi:hypothetical protein
MLTAPGGPKYDIDIISPNVDKSFGSVPIVAVAGLPPTVTVGVPVPLPYPPPRLVYVKELPSHVANACSHFTARYKF